MKAGNFLLLRDFIGSNKVIFQEGEGFDGTERKELLRTAYRAISFHGCI